MNFLSHYYFDRSNDPWFNTGLVLPDLSRNFCKGHLDLNQPFEGPRFTALRNGSIVHLAKDKIFHQSAFFNECTHAISELLDACGQWPRKWFFNHVLTEITLDRVLMDADPELCTAFYNDLHSVDAAEVARFLAFGGVKEYALFESRFNKFIEYAFIFDYQHNEKINTALSQLYRRVGIHYTWTESDYRLIQNELPKIIGIVGANLEKLTKELNNA